MRSLRLATAFVMTLAVSLPASAHPAPFSYLDVRLSPTGTGGTLVLHDRDVAHELGLSAPDPLMDPSTLERYAGSIASLVQSRLRMTADGREIRWEITGIRPLADRTAIEVAYRAPLTSSAGYIMFHAALFPYDPTHQTFVNVYEQDILTRQEGRRPARSY